MVGSIELDPDGENLVIRFPYRPDLVEQVRTLPGRRWDRGHKVWRVPAAHVDEVYQMFSAHRFEFASEVSGLLAGTLRTGAAALAEPPAPAETDPAEAAADATEADAFTVSQLNQRALDALRGTFTGPVWVIGEVVGFDRNKNRKHLYFSLVEKAPGDSQVAQADAVMFAGRAAAIRARLAGHAEPMTIRDGIAIRALVRVELYVSKGKFQLIVEDIDPEFTLGKLALDREKILRELRAAGLERRNAELPLPSPPLRIGVLSSPDAEGWNDFRRQLAESGFGFQVTLHPVLVQGDQLQATMLAGLAWFAERAGEFDALCIVRGGGSRTDLAWFDDRELAFAVARHPLKILCGIGHLRDRSVLDEIAHSEKTPTAVAAFLVKQVDRARAELQDLAARLRVAADHHLRRRRRALTGAGQDLRRHLHGRVIAARGHLHSCARVLRTAPIALLRDRVGAGLQRSVERLGRGAGACLDRLQRHLGALEERRRLLDPRRVLARGYALVFGPDGRVVPEVGRMEPGMRIDLQLRDGRAGTRVEEIRPEN